MDWPEAVTFCCWGVCGAYAYWAWLNSAIKHRELSLDEREQDLEERKFAAEHPTLEKEHDA